MIFCCAGRLFEATQKATSWALKAFFSKHNCQDVERGTEEIRKAVCATHDQAVVRSAMIMIQATARLIQAVQQDISQCEERIEHLTKSHPDFGIFGSLPGASDALIPRLIAALGTQRDRFASAAEIQSYSGVAPVVKQSGNTKLTHSRQAYPRFLRQTFHEWALHSIQKSTWARGQETPQCHSRSRLQMDSNPVPLVERRAPLR